MSDNKLVISDEAVEAANDAYTEALVDLRLREGGGFKVVSQQRRALRAALEAAAPHIAAEAWNEGWGAPRYATNPYRSQA
jgi:hypothetical protein